LLNPKLTEEKKRGLIAPTVNTKPPERDIRQRGEVYSQKRGECHRVYWEGKKDGKEQNDQPPVGGGNSVFEMTFAPTISFRDSPSGQKKKALPWFKGKGPPSGEGNGSPNSISLEERQTRTRRPPTPCRREEERKRDKR